MIALLLSLAFADSGCLAPPSGDSLAVAWVSKVNRTVGAKTYIDVVPATAIRQQDFRTVGELVHGLGLQKKKTAPKKPYKVTIFEVDPRILCRPIDGAEPGERVAGVPACESARTTGKSDGSGCMADVPVYRISWSDASARGFCVLPAQRFVDEGLR
ncbi:MAG: hypothetical protein EP330_19795 [Deltaproteobacteria bacterium]|nr:MAG: hypothetical protein EP330_19795 [Deltaproteobacteria bacterium]